MPVAHSRVSTGTPGHPTPTGVFSIIQKDRWHRSNLYGNAPMSFMQRITWSGVAMHQGIVPNYPASHGCIRLPEAFARQLWATTKMGARVIVARGDVTPVAIAHAKLFTTSARAGGAKSKPSLSRRAESSSTDLVRQAYSALETARPLPSPTRSRPTRRSPATLPSPPWRARKKSPSRRQPRLRRRMS